MENKGRKIYISNILMIILIVIAIFIYNKYDFNFYSKGILETDKTVFSRDAKVKCCKYKSYKIENKDYNDAMFYKNIHVNKFTPYRVTCKIKTENVIGKDNNSLAGAQICIPGTEEHSAVITKDSDWTIVEFLFNSKNSEYVDVAFRLGGNLKKAKGTAWFSDIKIEEGTKNQDSNWKFGCFIIEKADVEVQNMKYNIDMTNFENELVYTNMRRFKETIREMSNNQMTVDYDIIKINEPLKTLSYDKENGYYIDEDDIYLLINDYVKENEYDHIFICTNIPLEKELVKNKDVCEWVGLGNMMYLGKGMSNIKLMEKAYEYSNKHTFPEEVFVHEFLHTLERNADEYGFKRPILHDLEKYNYKDDKIDGQRKWYIDYMNCNIKTSEGYIGLPHEIYKFKPVNSSNFEYSYEIDRFKEPSSIKEHLDSIIYKIKNIFIYNKDKIDFNIVTQKGE